MVVLKATQFTQDHLEQEAFNLNDIEAEAKQILESAKKQRQELLDQSIKEIEASKQDAQKQGHDQGYQQGLIEGKQDGAQQALEEARQNFAQQNEQALQTLINTLQNFDQIKDQILFQAEQGTVQLALAVAQKIVKLALDAHPEIAAQNVKAAIALIARATDILIYVNPQDVELVSLMTQKDTAFNKYNNIRIHPDQNIERGGCLITTEQGQIDAQLNTQINRIAQELIMLKPQDDSNNQTITPTPNPQKNTPQNKNENPNPQSEELT